MADLAELRSINLSSLECLDGRRREIEQVRVPQSRSIGPSNSCSLSE
jgi:hypothetical protein